MKNRAIDAGRNDEKEDGTLTIHEPWLVCGGFGDVPLAVVPAFNWYLLPGGVSKVFWHAATPPVSATWSSSRWRGKRTACR